MKIQFDIPRDINKKLKIERIERDFKSIPKLIIKILEEHFGTK